MYKQMANESKNTVNRPIKRLVPNTFRGTNKIAPNKGVLTKLSDL
jgi:hypothetical protein